MLRLDFLLREETWHGHLSTALDVQPIIWLYRGLLALLPPFAVDRAASKFPLFFFKISSETSLSIPVLQPFFGAIKTGLSIKASA